MTKKIQMYDTFAPPGTNATGNLDLIRDQIPNKCYNR